MGARFFLWAQRLARAAEWWWVAYFNSASSHRMRVRAFHRTVLVRSILDPGIKSENLEPANHALSVPGPCSCFSRAARARRGFFFGKRLRVRLVEAKDGTVPPRHAGGCKKFKKCDFSAAGDAFGLPSSYYKCSVSERSEYFVYESRAKCAEAIEAMRANEPWHPPLSFHGCLGSCDRTICANMIRCGRIGIDASKSIFGRGLQMLAALSMWAARAFPAWSPSRSSTSMSWHPMA